MTDEYRFLEVGEIQFDTENPRIKKALEKYSDKITAERIHFALRSASEDSNATSSFTRLRDSIRASGSITQPITVVIQGDRKICIDGNTRLAIYQEFLKEETDGDWSLIPALVIRNAKQRDIETIRVSAHLVGPRRWPAYEKARYLHYLYHQKFMAFGEMVALCGGNQNDIERQIAAYEDMNDYYRDVVDDTAFHIDRFSGFVELQNSGVKNAVFEAGFELRDFGEWIRDGKIKHLDDVRQLTKVLRDKNATTIFVDGGIGSIKQAVKHLEREAWAASKSSPSSITLEEASINLLAQTLTEKIGKMPWELAQALQEGKSIEDIETVQLLESLADRLGGFLANVRK